MAKLIWDADGERLYETGVDRAVLFPFDPDTGAYGEGVAWNGITAVNTEPTGGEPTPLYADNIKYLNIMSAEEFAYTIEAFQAPSEFARCEGQHELVPGVKIGQQRRIPFAFSWRTLIGNDVAEDAFGYKVHLAYGSVASPSSKSYATKNDTPEAVQFSWSVATTPVTTVLNGDQVTTAYAWLDTIDNQTKVTALEAILYGSAENPAKMPTLAELAAL